jgi:hypothetical protein
MRSLGAIDDLADLIDQLNRDKPEARTAAAETLAAWIAAARDNDYVLYDHFKQRYKANDAETMLSLLHGFSDAMAARPETYELLINYLMNSEMPIRELASWNLNRLVPGAKTSYDAADTTKRELGYRQWLKIIPPGKLPSPALRKAAATTPGAGVAACGLAFAEPQASAWPFANAKPQAADSSEEPAHQLVALGELELCGGSDDLVVRCLATRRDTGAGDRERNHAVGVGPRAQRRAVVG